MASVSTSHLILFIASLLIAASVAGTFTSGVQRLSSALGDRSVDVMEDVRTDVEIISDPGSSAVYDGDGEGNVTLLVKNTGRRDLEAENDKIDVLIDGKYQVDVTLTVVDGQYWTVGNVVKVEIDPAQTLANGDHRVTVIVNEDTQTLRFRTP
ncbi:flagellar protein G [Halorussus halophilus]|uniref:flagellar protein G n=1 Tax=Halorussus halophilus TaxID=2650975 RepID=UPI0013016DEC|nr:flagellar protein G [Halorussus halophilus]